MATRMCDCVRPNRLFVSQLFTILNRTRAHSNGPNWRLTEDTNEACFRFVVHFGDSELHTVVRQRFRIGEIDFLSETRLSLH